MLRNRRKKFAFTLIELLVVIAIIAILAAILWPVFTAARHRKSGNYKSSNGNSKVVVTGNLCSCECQCCQSRGRHALPN